MRVEVVANDEEDVFPFLCLRLAQGQGRVGQMLERRLVVALSFLPVKRLSLDHEVLASVKFLSWLGEGRGRESS